MAADPPFTIACLAPLIRSGAVTSSALVDRCLERIDRLNPQVNAFIIVTAAEARADARAADAEIAAGRYRGPLHGIPVSLKDLIDLRGFPTTAASRVRDLAPASADAPVVALLREAGAIFVGKCNLHEFAFGTTSEDSAFGAVRNPHDPGRSAGGSSGGSAAAVWTEMCVASVGTDTGGSIRIPASACAVVGLKPGYDEISKEGVVPLSTSLDHVGPIARCVQDAWLMYAVMTGHATPSPIEERRVATPPRVRLGIPAVYFLDRLDTLVTEAFEDTRRILSNRGVDLIDVEIPQAETIFRTYVNVVLPEAAAFHAPTLDRRPDDYTPPVRERLQLARSVTQAEYAEGLTARDRLRRDLDAVLADVDALLLPTLPIAPPPLGAQTVRVGDEEMPVRTAMLRLTQLFNLTGTPALSIPAPRRAGNLPIGIQLAGRSNGTRALLEIALLCERLLTGSG